VSKPATKTRALTLRPHEARRLAEHGRVLIVRELKPQPPDEPAIQALSGIGYSVYAHEYDKTTTGVWWLTGPIWAFRKLGFETQAFRCPFGPVGSELWGRERYHDRGDYSTIGKYATNRYVYPATNGCKGGWLLHQAVTMPAAASRFPRLVLAACEVKRAGEATPDEIAATGLGDGPLDIPADRWCWFATIERSDA